MTRFVLLLCTFVLTLSLTGCGGPDSLMKKQIGLLNDQSDAIEKNDVSKYRRAVDEMKETAAKIKQLNLSDEEKKRLTDKFKADWEKALERFLATAEKHPEFMKKVDAAAAK